MKTKYYFITDENLKRGMKKSHDIIKETLSERETTELINSVCRMMRTEASILTNLMNWFIQFTEERGKIIDLYELNNLSNSFAKTFVITDETFPIYQEFERKIAETIEKHDSSSYVKNGDSNITHISTHIFIPIKDLLDWRKKSKRR